MIDCGHLYLMSLPAPFGNRAPWNTLTASWQYIFAPAETNRCNARISWGVPMDHARKLV
jgi:hypothetical protein